MAIPTKCRKVAIPTKCRKVAIPTKCRASIRPREYSRRDEKKSEKKKIGKSLLGSAQTGGIRYQAGKCIRPGNKSVKIHKES